MTHATTKYTCIKAPELGTSFDMHQAQAAYLAGAIMQVMLLSSLDAMVRRDRQIAEQQVTYITHDAALQQSCQGLGWHPLQASKCC